MKKVELRNLAEALEFVAHHGGLDTSVSGYDIPDFFPAQGAFNTAGSFVRLKDGSFFGVEAYSNGPLSEVTPDEDFGVKILGWTV